MRRLFNYQNYRLFILSGWSVSWQMALIMFLMFLIGLSDVYVAGKISKEVQAAYGLAAQLYFIFTIFAMSLTVGTVSVVSRLFPSNRKSDLYLAVGSSLISVFFAGIFFSFVGVLFSEGIIGLFRFSPALKTMAVPMLRIYSVGMVANYLLVNTNGILRACGLIKRSLLSMVIVCALNVFLNFYFAFSTSLGFKGIAWATVLSTTAGCALNLFYMRKLLSARPAFSWAMAGSIFAVGWPAGILQILWQLSALALFMILGLIPNYNVEILAAFTNGLKIEAAIFLPAFAFNMAAAVIVGNLLGKQQQEDAFRAGIATALAGVVFVAAMTVIVLFNAQTISALLSDNGIVVRECARYIYIALLFEPVMAWGVILSGGLNGAGDTRSVMFIIALSVWLVRVPLAYLLGVYFGLGPAAVWWAMNLSISCQAVLITKRYLSRAWMHAPHAKIPLIS